MEKLEFVPEGYPKYPKIETVFNRDKDFKVNESSLRIPEVKNIRYWLVTEKIDGTSGRVVYDPNIDEMGKLFYGGRTDKSDEKFYERLGIPELLARYFTLKKMKAVFPDVKDPVTFFMEFYGPKINSSGALTDEVSFRIFDIRVGDIWLEWSSVEDIAGRLWMKPVPVYHMAASFEKVVEIAKTGVSMVGIFESRNRVLAEGVVCRTVPLLLRRNGQRLVFKLKKKDFRKEE